MNPLEIPELIYQISDYLIPKDVLALRSVNKKVAVLIWDYIHQKYFVLRILPGPETKNATFIERIFYGWSDYYICEQIIPYKINRSIFKSQRHIRIRDILYVPR